MTDWKEISRRVKEMHDQAGGSAILVPQGLNVFGFSPPVWLMGLKKPLLEVDGPQLTVKKIRTYLFENRGVRAVHRPRLVVWSLYDPRPSGGVSVLGLGTLVSERAGRRLKPRTSQSSCSFEFVDLVQESVSG